MNCSRSARRALPERRGLEGGSVNKNLAKLKPLVRFLRGEGAKFDPIDFDILRVPKTKRGRDLTQAATPRAQNLLFNLPVFTGCAGPERMFEEGQEIYQCGNYFIPLLLKGDGARREEIASMKVDEVIFDGPIAVLDIKENEYRELKTLASPRELPVSPGGAAVELQGRYWQAIKDLNYDLLFPELWWEGSETPSRRSVFQEFCQGARHHPDDGSRLGGRGRG